MRHIDLNCDLGEEAGNDNLLMPFITSANIACGYHAGDEISMATSVQLCQQYNVSIGAHPSFPDRANFGRTNRTCTPAEVYTWVQMQIKELETITKEHGAIMRHVKPHGALYNQAAKDKNLARAIADAIFDTNRQWIMIGLSGSYLISEAKAIGLTTASEVFADRTYQDDGSLTPRTSPNAMIADENKCVAQLLQMINYGTVKSLSGKEMKIEVQTVCLHGDGQHAVAFAKEINKACLQEGIRISPLTNV